jgi:hypothetical protein
MAAEMAHTVASTCRILAHCWTGREVMLMRLIRFRLLPNVLVVAYQPEFALHSLDNLDGSTVAREMCFTLMA